MFFKFDGNHDSMNKSFECIPSEFNRRSYDSILIICCIEVNIYGAYPQPFLLYVLYFEEY